MGASGEAALSRGKRLCRYWFSGFVAIRRSLYYASHLEILGFEVKHHVDLDTDFSTFFLPVVHVSREWTLNQ